MRAITVRQPWAWAIVYGGKTVENRSRNIAGNYRGPVAIHAGLTVADLIETQDRLIAQAVGQLARRGQQEGRTPVPARITDPDEPRFHVAQRFGHRGAIIGTAHLIDVHHATICPDHEEGGPWPMCSPWAERDAWHLVLTGATPLPEPIPARGRLGLWRLDPDLIDGTADGDPHGI